MSSSGVAVLAPAEVASEMQEALVVDTLEAQVEALVVDLQTQEVDLEKLVDGISEYQNDWDKICQESLAGKFTAAQCVLKFLELPLTENMLAKISGNQQQAVQTTRTQADAASQS